MLSDEAKTKEQLVSELVGLRQGVAESETLETERKRVEEELRETEARNRSLVNAGEHMGEAIFLLQDTDKVEAAHLFANKEWTRITGYTTEELRGTSYYDVIHPRHRAAVADRVRRRLQQGQDLPGRWEISVIAKGGTEVPIEVGGGGPITYHGKLATVGYARDITERKRAEEALRKAHDELEMRVEERTVELVTTNEVLQAEITERKRTEEELQRSKEKLHLMFESVTDGISVIDLNGLITEVNQRTVEMHGFGSKDELLGKSAFKIVAPRDHERIATNMRQALKQGTIRGVEYTLLKADGSEFPGELSTSMLKDAWGNVVGHISIARDITERKRAEEALKESEHKYRALFESTLDGAFVIDAETMKVVLANEAAAKIYGFDSAQDAVGTNMLDFVPPEDRERVIRIIAEDMFEKDLRQVNEFRPITRDGREIWISAVGVRTEYQGRLAGLISFREITERKQAEEALRKTEQEKAAILNSMSEVVVYQDREMRILWTNRAAGESVGVAPEQLVGRHCYEIWPQRSQPCVGCPIIRARETGQPQETEMTTPDERVWFVRGYPIQDANGDLIGTVEVVLEITEHKQAEKALQEAEERYHAIFEQAADSIVLIDAETGALVEFNDRAYQSLGYSRKEFRKLKISDFEVTESAEDVAKRIKKIIKQGFDVFETKHRTRGGEIRDILVSARAICIGGRDFVQGIWRDITERKQAEEALRDSEERYSSLVNNVKLGILRSTPGPPGRILEVNPAMEEITGYSREELLKIDISKMYVHPEEREAILEEIALARGAVTVELQWRKRDGTEMVVLDTVVAVRDDTGKILYFDAIIENITERKQAGEREKELQQQLNLSSRLASIGELAAGVAHEISNPLTGILGFSQRLMRKSTDEEIARDLEIIHSEAQRVAKVVGNLLAFARRREPKKEHLNINDILQEALELRAYALETSNIEVATSLAPSLPKTMADFHQIQEVFLNIILNAEQAMSEASGEGRLCVRTQPTRDYIRISFADDGPGIPAEQLDKIFDPFFTTRGEKGGTGLGLSLCHGIVTEHAGKIYAKSKPGKGATFFVELPLSPVGASFADIY